METTIPGNVSPADTKYFALQVALQTMKERCIQLQRRLSTMEEENQKLRENTIILPSETQILKGFGTEVELQMQVDDLQRQKTRLTERVNMVSDENRKLWSRLSQLSKEQIPIISGGGDQIKSDETIGAEPSGTIELSNTHEIAGVNQNLIRSKTFTQHSPNPHLRPKLISDRSSAKDMSMEDIVLEDMGAGEAYASADEAELGFPYMQVEDKNSNSHDNDFNVDAKRCMEGLQELRREAMKQQKELTTALKTLEANMVFQPCPECAERAQKPEMADKSLETDESLSELKNLSDKRIGHDTSGQNAHATPTQVLSIPRLNIIQEKINADALDKTCPMCGKLYNSNVSFKAFQEHVEMHFIDDTSLELESSIERNFEFISHAVGDF